VNAPTGRAFIAAPDREALLRWVVSAKAGASKSAIAISEALPAAAKARNLFKTS
jgi:hypothetical protein